MDYSFKEQSVITHLINIKPDRNGHLIALHAFSSNCFTWSETAYCQICCCNPCSPCQAGPCFARLAEWSRLAGHHLWSYSCLHCQCHQELWKDESLSNKARCLLTCGSCSMIPSRHIFTGDLSWKRSSPHHFHSKNLIIFRHLNLMAWHSQRTTTKQHYILYNTTRV